MLKLYYVKSLLFKDNNPEIRFGWYNNGLELSFIIAGWIYIGYDDYSSPVNLLRLEVNSQSVEGNLFGFYYIQSSLLWRYRKIDNTGNYVMEEVFLGPLTPFEWHFVVFEFNEGHYRVFIDNYLKSSGNIDTKMFGHGIVYGQDYEETYLIIGGDGFLGKIADLMVYNHSLTDMELDYLLSSGIIKDGLVFWLYLDDNYDVDENNKLTSISDRVRNISGSVHGDIYVVKGKDVLEENTGTKRKWVMRIIKKVT